MHQCKTDCALRNCADSPIFIIIAIIIIISMLEPAQIARPRHTQGKLYKCIQTHDWHLNAQRYTTKTKRTKRTNKKTRPPPVRPTKSARRGGGALQRVGASARCLSSAPTLFLHSSSISLIHELKYSIWPGLFLSQARPEAHWRIKFGANLTPPLSIVLFYIQVKATGTSFGGSRCLN